MEYEERLFCPLALSRIVGRDSVWFVLAIIMFALWLPSDASAVPPRNCDSVTSRPRPQSTPAPRRQIIFTFGNGIAGIGGDSAAVAAAIAESERAECIVLAAEEPIRYVYRWALIGFSASVSQSTFDSIQSGLFGSRFELNTFAFLPELPQRPYRPWLGLPSALNVPVIAKPNVGVRKTPIGLDRIDQPLFPLDDEFHLVGGSSKVHVYVIDSGIYADHSEFEDRVLRRNAPGEGFDGIGDLYGTGDCRGHGSHVAGIIGGKTVGVARNVILHPVRILPCGSTPAPTDLAIKAVDWVTGDHATETAGKPAIANISLKVTGGGSEFLNLAISNSIRTGITYVIAASNDTADACNVSPAKADGAITVGSVGFLNKEDRKLPKSNFGRCVEIFAPGQDIPSVALGNPYFYILDTGTSMAAPHVAGVAALYLANVPSASPSEVWRAICGAANKLGITRGWSGIHYAGAESREVLLNWASPPRPTPSDADLPIICRPDRTPP